MRPKEGVVDRLNGILTKDLTAINQYFLQAEIVRSWGFERLYKHLRELSMGEMQDAQAIARHILYLEGLPNLQRLGTVRVGESVEEHLRLDLETETEAVQALTEAITHCASVEDYTTRDILEEMVREEEEHVDWLETQLDLISRIGIEHYLAQQMNE